MRRRDRSRHHRNGISIAAANAADHRGDAGRPLITRRYSTQSRVLAEPPINGDATTPHRLRATSRSQRRARSPPTRRPITLCIADRCERLLAQAAMTRLAVVIAIAARAAVAPVRLRSRARRCRRGSAAPHAATGIGMPRRIARNAARRIAARQARGDDQPNDAATATATRAATHATSIDERATTHRRFRRLIDSRQPERRARAAWRDGAATTAAADARDGCARRQVDDRAQQTRFAGIDDHKRPVRRGVNNRHAATTDHRRRHPMRSFERWLLLAIALVVLVMLVFSAPHSDARSSIASIGAAACAVAAALAA
ncbi:MAG: hypothetical protein WDW36_008300 [Sanguina aurantia]